MRLNDLEVISGCPEMIVKSSRLFPSILIALLDIRADEKALKSIPLIELDFTSNEHWFRNSVP